MEVADPPSGWRGFERFGDRRGGGANRVVIERAGRAGLVEEREKLFAPLVVVFPWIFPVEHNGDGHLVLRRLVNNVAQPTKNIFCGRFRSGLMVDEPKGIGDLPIAKQYRNVLSLRPDQVGLI